MDLSLADMDVLRWYITLRDIFEKKPCEDAEVKFGMVELLLGCQGKKDFMRLKKTVAEALVVYMIPDLQHLEESQNNLSR